MIIYVYFYHALSAAYGRELNVSGILRLTFKILTHDDFTKVKALILEQEPKLPYHAQPDLWSIKTLTFLHEDAAPAQLSPQ